MPKKILVVDDEKPISDIIKFNLTKEGFDVDTAYDGEEAVKKVEEYDPDLMILDLMLPKKDTADAMSFKNMGGQGIEPWTHGLRVRCSAS